jgi:xanthine dehydrogenase molybdopterin-binding subunit B
LAIALSFGLSQAIAEPETHRVRSLDAMAQQPANRIGGQSDVEVLNARKVYWLGNKIQKILLAIENITERARLEREHAAAHERMLLQELTHRVKNSLQFIASMVMIEARSHKRGEGKASLERVSHRITLSGSSIQSYKPAPLRALSRRFGLAVTLAVR